MTKMAFVSTQTEKVVMVDKFTEFYNFLPNYADFIAEKQDTGIQTDSIEEGVPQHLVLPEAQGQPEPLPEEAGSFICNMVNMVQHLSWLVNTDFCTYTIF